jgi:hypothetical protein
MTPITNDTTQGVVQNLRSIRDQISLEITSMTFEQERAYLDKLLSEKQQASAQQGRSASGAVS